MLLNLLKIASVASRRLISVFPHELVVSQFRSSSILKLPDFRVPGPSPSLANVPQLVPVPLPWAGPLAAVPRLRQKNPQLS